MSRWFHKQNWCAIFFSVFVMLSFFSCSKEKQEQTSELIRPVRYVKIIPSTGDSKLSFSGIAKTGKLARISFRVSGKVEKIAVKDGDRIQQGDLIATLDASDAQLTYEKVLSGVDKSRVYRDTAKSNLERIKSLYESNNVSLNEYEAAKEKYANSNAAYLADRRTADLQKKELGYYTLQSPITGVVSGFSVETGENVSAGQVILEIHSMDEMEVDTGIPDAYIAGIQKGQTVSVAFTPIPDKTFEGRVTEVSYNVDDESSTYPVTVRLLSPSSKIRPGMPANVRFSMAAREQKDSLLVPINAVGKDDQGNFVYIVKDIKDKIGVVEKKHITVGSVTNEGFEALHGIEYGNLVVTAGISHLSNGLKVRVQ